MLVEILADVAKGPEHQSNLTSKLYLSKKII
jgi:hypothetical protein